MILAMRTRSAHRLIAVAAGVSLAASAATGTISNSAGAQENPEWLTVVNAYRTSAGLPALTNDAALQRGVDLHVQYLSTTGSLQHGESTSSALFTNEGNLAGQQSLLGGTTGGTKTDRELIDGWMVAPFHSIHLFEPRLTRTAFASVQGLSGRALPSAAVLNIIGGIGPRKTPDRAIVFPGRDSVVPLTTFAVETPDPLTSCPGYEAPAGMGLVVIFNEPAPLASATLATADGVALESCVIDGSYRNPNASAQATVRTILGQKNGVVVIPRLPLTPGTTYRATVAAGRQSVEWSFGVSTPGGPLPTPAASVVVLSEKSGSPKTKGPKSSKSPSKTTVKRK